MPREDNKGVTTGVLDLFDSLQHIFFIFNGRFGLVDLKLLLAAGRDDRRAAALAELDRGSSHG